MNQAVVDRAIEALVKVGATGSPKRPADKPTKPEGRKSEAVCWHCGGERRCACSTCALEERGRPAGPCAACRGTGKVSTWIQ